MVNLRGEFFCILFVSGKILFICGRVFLRLKFDKMF